MSDYPFSRILLATEHTEFDAGAERLAFAMAQRCGVPLRVVFPLLSNPEYEAEMPEHALRAEQDVAVKIDDLRKTAAAAGVQLDVQVRRGSEIHTEIVNDARAYQADLIVIRRRGKPSFFARMMVGEMVSRVIRDTTCSVLLVPRKAQFWNTQVLAAVGDTPAAPSIAKTAGLIAGICDLPLTVLSVTPDQASLSKTQSFNTLNVALAAGSSDKVRGEVRVGQAVEQTVAAVTESRADLVVIGRQRYHLIPFGHRSIMQEIAGKMEVSTLVVTN
ncbi:MAG: universal stress protein [Gallionella sp.]|nr:universal stress protein [Gallionella sp.]MDD4959762.1 universal stress protein [Gallionella sp.]